MATVLSPHRRTLVRGACVLSLDPDVGDFDCADVAIEGERILAVGRNLDVADAEIIDGAAFIAMPGFVDSHRHIWEGVLRNILPDGTLADYMRDIPGRLAPGFRPEDVYISSYVSALGAINAGVTTLLDWSQIQNSPEHTDAAVRALQDSRMRAVFAYGPPSLGRPWWTLDTHAYPDDINRLRKSAFSSDDQLLSLAIAATGPEFAPYESVARVWGVARDAGARISVHAGIGARGKLGHYERMGRDGLLAADTTYIHCGTLNPTEWRMIADTGGSVSISPQIEMQMGHGTPPIQTAIEHGLRPSLSVDVETSAPSDFFTQMRSALAIQRGLLNARALDGETDLPRLLTARDVLEMATIEGARANGLDHKTGTLTPGKQADMILLRADMINVIPINDPVGAIVLGMDVSNVDTVFVAGSILKRDGRLVGVDVRKLRDQANAARDHVTAAANFPRCPLCRSGLRH